MSNRLVLSVLLVAILLGAGMWVFWSAGPPGGARMTKVIPAGERLAVIEPATLEAIVLTWPKRGPSQRLSRSASGADSALGEWTVTQADQRAWKLNPDRVGGFVRLLQQARTVAEPSDAQLEKSSVPGEGWHIIELNSASGKPGSGTTTIRLSTRSLAGQVLAQVTTPTLDGKPDVERWGVVSDELMRVMSAGAMSWRETALLAGLMRDCVGVRITSAGTGEPRQIALQRLRAIWRITAPVSGTADGPSVDRVLSALQGLTITDFLETKRAEPARVQDTSWTASPSARVVIDVTARNPQGESAGTREVELLLGPVADASGRTLFATIDGGATIVVVDAQAFAAIPTDPAKFLSKRSSDVAIADVARVEVVDAKATGASAASAAPTRTFTRSTDGWSSQSGEIGGSAPVLLDRERSGEVAAFIEALIKTDALGVLLTEPAGLTRLAGVTLANEASEPLDAFELFKDASNQLAVLARATPSRSAAWRTYKTTPALVERFAR